MLQVSLHALGRAPGSQQPAREAPGKVEVEKPRSIHQKSMHRKRDKECHSIQQKSVFRK